MVHVVQGGPGALAFGPGKMTWISNRGDGSCGSGGPGGTWCSLILDLLFADAASQPGGLILVFTLPSPFLAALCQSPHPTDPLQPGKCTTPPPDAADGTPPL